MPMSTTKQWACLLGLDLFFLHLSFSFSLGWHLAGRTPLKIVALAFSLVSSVWSLLRWQEDFGDLAYDAVTKGSSNEQWSLWGGHSEGAGPRMRRWVEQSQNNG
ncbi:hypothetical protein C365_02762 [Cryptococcus neoformans Bt85]|nr:hypothetical protein C365_02762 [Cryptococcus neoformans var. grubii Bt85]